MNADEARQLTKQNTERQNEIAKLIKDGEKKLNGLVTTVDEKPIYMQAGVIMEDLVIQKL